MKNGLLVSIVFSFFSSYAQNLTLEAIHYGINNQPISIEKKYESESKLIYVSHTNAGSLYLQDDIIKKSDTIIIEESLFEIVRINPKDKLTSLDGFTLLSDDSSKTLTLSIYNFEKDEYLGDTLFPADFNTTDFIYDLKHSRLNQIIENKIIVPYDSLIFKEKTKTFFVNKIPVKCEFYNSKGMLHLITSCTAFLNTMNCKSYNPNSPTELISVDTIRWNKDTSEIEWLKTINIWDKHYLYKYYIDNKQLVISTNERQDTIQYLHLNKSKIVANLITENLFYYDFPLSFYLKFDFDRQKIVKRRNSTGYTKSYNYDFDVKQRIIGKSISINDTITQHIKYRHFETN